MTRLRPVLLGPRGDKIERWPDGALTLRSPEPLGPYPTRLTERLTYWAAQAGQRVVLAERDGSGGWRTISFAAALASVRRIGQALIDRGLSPERPLLILSASSIDHALLALAAMHVGIPYVPLSPGYSLLSSDFARVRHVVNLITPGLVYAASGRKFGKAIEAAVPPMTEVAVGCDPAPGRPAIPFSALADTVPTAAVEEAAARVTGDTIAKLLFTSGSTAMPKGVINTHRMLCSNQQMVAQTWPLLTAKPPVIVDWSPWNHTLGSNTVFGVALYNGGSLYIDAGKPTPAEFDTSVRNLAEIAPTVYFGVPICYQMLLAAMERDESFRRRLLARMEMMFYAGAVLAPKVWEEMNRMFVETCGERIFMTSSLGATETGPMTTASNWDTGRPSVLGLPVPGVELKLVPTAGKLEVRVRSPSVTPGYWRQPELTAKAFDEDGWYCSGDAVRFVDPDDPSQGLLYDGRLSEDFKLSTGNWVNAGPLRGLANGILAPLVRDVVVTGHDRDQVGLLVFPEVETCRAHAAIPAEASVEAVLSAPGVLREFQRRLDEIARHGTSTSTRIVRMLIVSDPLTEGEMTDKRTISHGLVLKSHAAEIAELYAENPSARVLITGVTR